VSDNDSRETQETWEACRGEGVREVPVTNEIPERVQKLHDESLVQGRDVLKQADPDEQKKWLAKDGTDWSGAFGKDPATLVDKHGPRRPEDRPNSDYEDDENEEDDDDEEYSDSDLGIKEFGNSNGSEDTSGSGYASSGKKKGGLISQYKEYKENEKAMHRRHRGLMQWKPVRNAAFAKDEMKFGIKKMKNKVSLKGRDPDVETEV
jgi:hypothetical protein